MMIDVDKMTAAEAGLTGDRQIEIALEELLRAGGQAQIDRLYVAVERYMPPSVNLSEQGRASLRAFVSREAVAKGWIYPFDTSNPYWRITEEGRCYIEQVLAEYGTEQELVVTDESSQDTVRQTITEPFDPAKIKVDSTQMTVLQVMRKVALEEIVLQPEFQRNFVWNLTRQSRLIESILLRIPLPAFYLDATNDDRWLVVDGLQRLATLDSFYNRGELRLTNLEHLKDLEGKTFKDLPRNFQRLIEDHTRLTLYIILPETPNNVKFTIFRRVNTGGLVLTNQEIRHALYQGHATTFLAELAKLPEFLSATTGSINPLRMDDRECVLRFLAFRLTDYKRYQESGLDGFLNKTMEHLNKAPKRDLIQLREDFRNAMRKAETIFGRYAFRKFTCRDDRRSQISKPLFEVWSVLLIPYQLDELERCREALSEGFIKLMQQTAFERAISLGTGDVRSVVTRFSMVERLLEETVR
ncbi:MAG: DUF262 domain-containing protein [Chloroflexales bacterium]|nr:DUF262 domain-containing protein [Chloroflexales bacterium]